MLFDNVRASYNQIMRLVNSRKFGVNTSAVNSDTKLSNVTPYANAVNAFLNSARNFSNALKNNGSRMPVVPYSNIDNTPKLTNLPTINTVSKFLADVCPCNVNACPCYTQQICSCQSVQYCTCNEEGHCKWDSGSRCGCQAHGWTCTANQGCPVNSCNCNCNGHYSPV